MIEQGSIATHMRPPITEYQMLTIAHASENRDKRKRERDDGIVSPMPKDLKYQEDAEYDRRSQLCALRQLSLWTAESEQHFPCQLDLRS